MTRVRSPHLSPPLLLPSAQRLTQARPCIPHLGISRAYGGAHSSLSLTYTLTPASSLPLADALALSLVSLSDPDPEATLRGEGELARTWVETEVVEALYTRGRESETLGKWERVVVVPE